MDEELFENLSIPASEEDWSAARQIARRLKKSGAADILQYVSDEPSLLADLASSVEILSVNTAAVQTYRASNKNELLRAFNSPPDLNIYNPVTGLSDIFVEILHRFSQGETRVVLEGLDTALDGSVMFIKTTTSIVSHNKDDWGRIIQTVENIDPPPSMRNDLLLRERFIKFSNQNQTIDGLLNNTATPSLLIDENAQVIQMNGAADRLFAKSSSLSIKSKKITVDMVGEEAKLNQAIKSIIRPQGRHGIERTKPIRIKIRQLSSSRPYSFTVCPLPQNAYAINSHVVAAIYITDPESVSHSSLIELGNFYDLTNAERNLCEYLLNGMSLIDASQVAKITEGTARQRLKSVFQKTETNSQAALVRLLMTYSSF